MSTTDVIDDTSHIPAALVPVMEALARVGRDLSRTIKRGPLGGNALGAGVGENLGGDQQKALDVMADEAFAADLRDHRGALLRLRGAGRGGRTEPGGHIRPRHRPARRLLEHRRERLDRHDLLDFRSQGRRSERQLPAARPGADRRRLHHLRTADLYRGHLRCGRAELHLRPRQQRLETGRDRAQGAGESVRICHQRVELPSLEPGDPRLYRRHDRR